MMCIFMMMTMQKSKNKISEEEADKLLCICGCFFEWIFEGGLLWYFVCFFGNFLFQLINFLLLTQNLILHSHILLLQQFYLLIYFNFDFLLLDDSILKFHAVVTTRQSQRQDAIAVFKPAENAIGDDGSWGELGRFGESSLLFFVICHIFFFYCLLQGWELMFQRFEKILFGGWWGLGFYFVVGGAKGLELLHFIN